MSSATSTTKKKNYLGNTANWKHCANVGILYGTVSKENKFKREKKVEKSFSFCNLALKNNELQIKVWTLCEKISIEWHACCELKRELTYMRKKVYLCESVACKSRRGAKNKSNIKISLKTFVIFFTQQRAQKYSDKIWRNF